MENVINPVIRLGGVVIIDRYYWSTIAFGAGAGLDFDWLVRSNFCFRVPDITFILSVSPKRCMERIKKNRDNLTYFEQEDKLAKTAEVYLKLAEMFDSYIYVVNGELSKEEVFVEIKKILENNLI